MEKRNVVINGGIVKSVVPFFRSERQRAVVGVWSGGAWSPTEKEVVRQYKQNPRNLRRNVFPVEFINWPLLMCHEHLTGSLVELMQIVQTPSSAAGVLHGTPEPFNGIEMMSAVGR